FIGHYLAEGYKWKDRYICLVTRLKEEKEIHTKLRNILNSKNIKYHEYDKEAVKIFYITWPKMNKYLTEFGYMCYGKYLNQEALIAPHNKQRALIDGYLRGDGFKLKNQKGFGITSVSLLLLEGIKDILLRLGEIPYIVKLYEKGSRKSFGYNVRTAYSIRWYGKSHQKNFIEGDKYYQQIYKNKIKENTYSGDVYTLEVNESHEYNVMGLTCKNSQYYNDPSDPTSSRIDYNTFNYYKKEALEHDGLHWFFNKKKLSIYAGMDFAWTISKRSDYTAIVTIGITNESDILILDIDRFKTEKVSEMWDHVLKMHHKWDVRRLRAETNMGQKIIVAQFKEYIRQQGSLISVDDVYRTRHEGTKRERNTAILEPRYSQGKIWHYKGGNCQILEEELVNNFPEHDDIEDALASAVEIAKPPRLYMDNMMENSDNELVYNGRFGGIG
ncbi:MAG: LAGLIDADG family homing endonuclease, partial [Thermodesulfobacteriota bacterium]